MLKSLLCALILFTYTTCQVNPISQGKKLVQNVTFENFDVTVQKGMKLPYFLFFKMTKCGHCKMFEPTFYKLAYDLREEPVTFAMSNVDDDAE